LVPDLSKEPVAFVYKDSGFMDIFILFYVFFWVIPRRLNSNAEELPRRKHTTFTTRRKFEIKNFCFNSEKREAASTSVFLPNVLPRQARLV
jgi:hypothetical protein